MRDPFSWSFPIGSLFGVSIRVHFIMPVVMLGLILREVYRDGAAAGTWLDASVLMAILLVSVLLHELGHCFAARRVEGEANEVLLWPLGGLAQVHVPHTPRANLVTALGGPAVNLVLFVVAGLVLAFGFERAYQAPWYFLNWYPYRASPAGEVAMHTWDGSREYVANFGAILLARVFYINWLLFLLNVLLVGFPFDGGRILQCLLWPRVGYRQATLYAIFSGFGVMIVLLLVAFLPRTDGVMLVLLAWFVYASCKQEWIVLETGGEDSLFGYDFSQGYTSLEKDEEAQPPPPPRKKQNFLKRWLQRRAARKREQEQQQRIADDRRMDELLEKIQRHGKESLTDEEQRFLKRVSDRYRNRHPE